MLHSNARANLAGAALSAALMPTVGSAPASAALREVDPADGATTQSTHSIQGRTVGVAPDGLTAGTYTVAYQAISADGRPLAGTTTFTLTRSSTRTPLSLAGAATLPISRVRSDAR